MRNWKLRRIYIILLLGFATDGDGEAAWKTQAVLRLELRGGGERSSSTAILATVEGQSLWHHVTPHRQQQFTSLAKELEAWLKRERGVQLKDASREQILEAVAGVNATTTLKDGVVASNHPTAGLQSGDAWCGNRTNLSVDELNERMWLACQLGDEDIVQDAFNDGAEVNATDLCGFQAIHYAALCNQPSVMQTLLEDIGCDVDARTGEGLTALMIAAARGFTLLLDQLVIVGQAATNLRQTGTGATALHWAAAAGSRSSCVSLVEADGLRGSSALRSVGVVPRVEVTERRGRGGAGADLAAEDEEGRTAEAWARENAYEELALDLSAMLELDEQWEEHVRLVRKQKAGLSEKERAIAMEVGWADLSGVGLGAAPLRRVKGTTLLERMDPNKYHQGLPGMPPLDSPLVTLERLDPHYDFKDGIIVEPDEVWDESESEDEDQTR